MNNCNINQDILNNCLDYRTGGIYKIYLLPYEDFQAVRTSKGSFKPTAFNHSFDNLTEYSTILSTSKFYQLEADETANFKHTYYNHYYTQSLTTKVRRIDKELDLLLSKNKNKKFFVLFFPNLHNKYWKGKVLTSDFCFTMGDENGASVSIELLIEQVTGDNVYNITFSSNSYKPLSVMENYRMKTLDDYILNIKYIPTLFECQGFTNYEVAQYAYCVTNDSNEYAVDKDGRLCSDSNNKQAIHIYNNINNDVDVSNYDIVGSFDIDTAFDGRKVRKYNTTCYNKYNYQLYFTNDQEQRIVEELFNYEGGSKSYPITVLGGNYKYSVVSIPSWISYTIGADDTLTINVTNNEAESIRSGTIILQHNDKPDLQLTINITQAENVIIIPEFDYLVFRYYWGEGDGRDLDTSTVFMNTNIALPNDIQLDNSAVGWNMSGNRNLDVASYLVWGGDNTGSGNECTYINMNTLVTHYDSLPDVVEVNVYANWFGTRLNGNCAFFLNAYKGGAMVQDGYNFENVGGDNVLFEAVGVSITTQGGGNATDYQNNYTKIGTIFYNKKTRTATYVIDAEITA
ncbi:BACON domain-containing protein [Dysgonomonas sp. 520]|uniref:BACON domain-containing protein n=1 Tax=Dysgonomonas sp. 520 TaxID=2302931 RepID=UPI0013D0F3AD|nr:BACON domain-containing protein [Dysgonomonas sp. 520]NDW09825.1 hypothetical protein [Dysgonomonas sp. 520]